jgi:hypothetical protein
MSSVLRERKRTEEIRFATRLALAGMGMAVAAVAVSRAVTDARVPVKRQPAIDPEVRVVTQRGSARVLVELSIVEAHAVSRSRLIKEAQNLLLQRLQGASVRVLWRYTTVPLLALEIDAKALARLEAMSDLVTRVQLDSIDRPSTQLSAEA